MKDENGSNSNSIGKAGDEDDKDKNTNDSDTEDVDSKIARLTLMEEVLLLGLKDKEVSLLSVQ